MRHFYTYDLKLATILVTLGVPLRASDPITCVVGRGDGAFSADKKTYNFWFDTTKEVHNDLVTQVVRAHNAAKSGGVEAVQLDKEHPFFYLRAALDNREVLLGWVREKVVPMRIIEHGDRTLIISDKASARTKELMRGALTGDYSPKQHSTTT